MHFGLCPKCKVRKNLTKHHIFPIRHYGYTNITICLCRECHSELEKQIPFDKMDNLFYRQVVKNFLKGKKYEKKRIHSEKSGPR